MPTQAEGRKTGLFVRERIPRLCLVLFTALFVFLAGGCPRHGTEITLESGPPGSTFEKIATGMTRVLNEEIPGARFTVKSSGGSLENLFDVARGRRSMGLVFSGDAYLGSKGELGKGRGSTRDVRALARLYGAAAQLAVADQSSIRSLEDLGGRRVAIGGSGTGSALTARRFFKSIGLWDRIIPIHEGYLTGMDDLEMGNIDAVWFEAGVPNEYLLAASRKIPLRFLDLAPAAKAGGFFSRYPFYTPVVIPAGTYRHQGKEVLTFQDAVLWVANARVSEDLVYRALKALFSAKNLKQMRAAHPAARDMTVARGLRGVKIPLHSGARRFWREHGMALSGEGR